MKKSNVFWLLIFGGLLLASIAAALTVKNAPGGGVARIYQDGALLNSIDLSRITESYSSIVEHDGGYNEISVSPGSIRVSAADCPDGMCVRQGSRPGSAGPIVCLPHRLVIEVTSSGNRDVDSVAG